MDGEARIVRAQGPRRQQPQGPDREAVGRLGIDEVQGGAEEGEGAHPRASPSGNRCVPSGLSGSGLIQATAEGGSGA